MLTYKSFMCQYSFFMSSILMCDWEFVFLYSHGAVGFGGAVEGGADVEHQEEEVEIE